jgi:branched-chain amino acid transport system permease protein
MIAERFPAVRGVEAISFSIAPRRGAVSIIEMVVLASCIIAVIAALALSNRYAVDIMIRTFLWAGLALAWNIAGGYAGLISFGHAAFFGIGAYTSTILLLNFGVPPWFGMLAGALIAACAGALLTQACARLRGPFFILSTLAAGEVIRIAALNWRSLTGGAEGLEIPPVPNVVDMVFRSQWPYVTIVVAYMLAMFALSAWIEQTRYGYYLFATRDDEDGASAIGINPSHTRTAAMALSAATTAIGGTIFAQYFLYLDPTHVISPDISFQFALICAVGGLGTASGPVFGALIIVPLSELLRGLLSQSTSGLHLVIYGIVVIIVILYFPSGISGAIGRAVSRFSPARGFAARVQARKYDAQA